MQATPLVLATTLAALIGAATLTVHAQPAEESAPSLQPVTQNGIVVVTGGVGTDEDAAIKRLAAAYPLRIVISGRGGDYYVAQDFKLLKGGAPIVTLPSAGPWVLADLPPGRYTVQGVFDSEVQHRTFTLPAAGTTVHWVLPARLD